MQRLLFGCHAVLRCAVLQLCNSCAAVAESCSATHAARNLDHLTPADRSDRSLTVAAIGPDRMSSEQSPSASTSPHSVSTGVSGEAMAATADKSKRYDRGIRVWGAHGQEALEAARVCLLTAGPTGTEALKNLVLGGIHSFTIVDGAKVTPSDLGNNFLLTADGLGGSRAQCATGAWRCPVGGSPPPPALLGPAVPLLHVPSRPAAHPSAAFRFCRLPRHRSAAPGRAITLRPPARLPAAECLKELNESVAGSYVEEAPSSLLERLQLGSLEDVFLSLCRQDGDTEDMSLSSLDTVTSLPTKYEIIYP